MNVLSCEYALNQDVDKTGRPSSITRGGTLHLVLESTDNTKLFESMVSSFDKQDSTITFFKRDSNAKLKEINLKEGYVVNFGEGFNHVGSDPFSQKFSISAKEISIGNGKHTNDWV